MAGAFGLPLFFLIRLSDYAFVCCRDEKSELSRGKRAVANFRLKVFRAITSPNCSRAAEAAADPAREDRIRINPRRALYPKKNSSLFPFNRGLTDEPRSPGSPQWPAVFAGRMPSDEQSAMRLCHEGNKVSGGRG
jgi:hypothetical protein